MGTSALRLIQVVEHTSKEHLQAGSHSSEKIISSILIAIAVSKLKSRKDIFISFDLDFQPVEVMLYEICTEVPVYALWCLRPAGSLISLYIDIQPLDQR